MRKNNKGFSLVEIIIAVAILAVMTVVLTGLAVAGTNFYKRQSADQSLQMQSQIVMAQIREYVVDCTKVLAVSGNEKIKVERELSDIEVNGGVYSKYTHIFTLDGDIINYKLIKTRTGGGEEVLSGELVSGVSRFNVGGAAPGSNMITVDLELKKAFGKRTWAEKQNIALRNMLP